VHEGANAPRQKDKTRVNRKDMTMEAKIVDKPSNFKENK